MLKLGKVYRYALFCAFIFISQFGYASSVIIRDTEIDNFINNIAQPLLQKPQAEKINFIIYENKIPNIFVAGENLILISSSFIKQFKTPDLLQAAIAHQLGHMQKTKNSKTSNFYLRTYYQTPPLLLIPFFEKKNLNIKFEFKKNTTNNVGQEAEYFADQYAFNLLENANINPNSLAKLHIILTSSDMPVLLAKYKDAHPPTNNRRMRLDSLLLRSKVANKAANQAIPNETLRQFNQIKAKLNGFFGKDLEIQHLLNNEDTAENKLYIHAINAMKKDKFDDALNYVNKLLMLSPKDPYFHELKASIFLLSQKKLAISELDLAISLLDHSYLFHLGRAISGIHFYFDNQLGMNIYYNDLKIVLEHEPENIIALSYLKKYYKSKGMMGELLFTKAKIAYIKGHHRQSAILAQESIKHLTFGTSIWYQATSLLKNSSR